MKALLDARKRLSQTRSWTYLFLWLSIAFFGLAALVFVVTINAKDWRWTNDFPLPLWLALIASLLFTLLARSGKKIHAPKVSVSALGGLASVVAGSLGFSSNSIPGDLAIWITVSGLIITLVLLPFGWKSDAALNEQADEIAKLKAEIASQESELISRSKTIGSLRSQLTKGGTVTHPQRATGVGLMVASAMILLGVVGEFVGKTLSRQGSRI